MFGSSKQFSAMTSALIGALAIGGCNGTILKPGDMQLGLTQASATRQTQSLHGRHHIVSAMVVINEIDAHVQGIGWTPIMQLPTAVDLLHLDDQSITILGIAQLPQGHVNRLRMILDPNTAFVVDSKGNKSPLELPKGGIVKVVGKLDLDGCATGTTILDFDPKIRATDDDECGDRDLDCERDGNCVSIYRLRGKATLRTEEVKGQCTGSGVPCGNGNVVCAVGQICSPTGDCVNPPSSGQCGNGNVVCAPGQLCFNGDCIDPCLNVNCPSGAVCMLGQCVPSNQCQPDDDE